MLKTISEWWQGYPSRSPKWAAFRRGFLKTHRTCAACGTRDKLEVHHILPFHLYPNFELSPENCITLCSTGSGCHLTWGHLQDWKSWNPRVTEDSKNYLLRVQTRPFMKE